MLGVENMKGRIKIAILAIVALMLCIAPAVAETFSPPVELKVMPHTGGGTENGTYPITAPDDEGNYYQLFADKTTVYRQGQVTFKVFKIDSEGNKVGTEEADIYIDGEKEGTTSSWNPLGEKSYTHEFKNVGEHTVYAQINGMQTGELIIPVIEDADEVPPQDGGNLNLTVEAVNKYGDALGSIIIERRQSGNLLERVYTDAEGEATLHPVSGETFTITSIDPSNKYLPRSKTDSWSSDSSITMELQESDKEATTFEVAIDGNTEDGQTMKIGKHTIKALEGGWARVGATIKIDGEEVGETESGILSEAKLEHEFSEGEHKVTATYNGMLDTMTVIIGGGYEEGSIVLVAYPEGTDGHITGNFTVKKNQEVLFQVTKVGKSNSIWDWNMISDAPILVNGTQVGLTGDTDFGAIIGSFMGANGYVHSWNQSGEHKVSTDYTETAEAGAQSTNPKELWVTVKGEEYEQDSIFGSLLGGDIGGFLENLASQMPIIGNLTIDSILWGAIIVFGGLFAISFVLRLIAAMLMP